MNLRNALIKVRAEAKHSYSMLKTKDSSLRHVAIMLSGSVGSMLLQMVATPILSRIYSPEVYGEFSIFSAFALNLIGIATLSFQEAIPLAKSERDFSDLVQLITVSFVFWTLLLLVLLVYPGPSPIGESLGLGNHDLLWLLPLILLASIFNQVAANNNVRSKEFGKNARVVLGAKISSRVYSIGHGLMLSAGSAGLILGDLIQNLIGSFTNNPLRTWKALSAKFSLSGLRKTVNEFKGYPLFVFPSRWLLVLGNQIHVTMVGRTYSLSTLGNMGMAIMLLELPISILGGSLKPVMLKRLADCENNEEISRVVLKVYWTFILLGAAPISAMIVFGSELFTFFLGDNWKEAGFISSLLGFSYLFNIISTPLQGLRRVLRVESHIFLYSLLLFCVRCLVIPASMVELPFKHFLIVYAIGNGLFNLVNTASLLRLITTRYLSIILRSLLLLLGTTALMFGLRQLFHFIQ